MSAKSRIAAKVKKARAARAAAKKARQPKALEWHPFPRTRAGRPPAAEDPVGAVC